MEYGMMFRSDVSLNSPKGSAAVIDKGYTDYGWYKQLTENEIIFVNSQRANVKCRLIDLPEAVAKSGAL